jgi:hypothetical protein
VTVHLWPQVPRHRWAEIIAKAVAEGTVRRQDLRLEQMSFTSSGGTRLDGDALWSLRERLVDRLVADGIRLGAPNRLDPSTADQRIIAAVHDCVDISHGEASLEGVWVYLSGVLLKDIVHWRWNEKPSADRFEKPKRNALYCWWTAGQIFGTNEGAPSRDWSLMSQFGVDDIVQFVERPFLGGNRTVARALASSLAAGLDEAKARGLDRRTIVRDTLRRSFRTSALLAVRTFSPEDAHEWAQDQVQTTVAALAGGTLPQAAGAGVRHDASYGVTTLTQGTVRARIVAEHDFVEVSLLNDQTESGVSFGLNWGHRGARDRNESYLPVPAAVGRQKFLPDRGEVFRLEWPDGTFTDAVTAQDGGKAIQTCQGNAILGRKLRGALGLLPGSQITARKLKKRRMTGYRLERIARDHYRILLVHVADT